MIVFALLVAAATLAAGLVAALVVRRAPTVRLQLIGLALVSVLLPLGAVLLSGVVMFQSGHDLTVLAIAAASSTAALAAAVLVGRAILRPVEGVRATSVALAGGDLTARARPAGARELRELADSLNETAANLERLFEARRQLVAWASHDLRTPLASLQAMLEAVEDGLAEPERYLPGMREQVRVLGMLIDDLFELARIDAGVLKLELRDAPLTPLVETCLRGIEAEAEAKRVRLEARIDGAAAARCAPRQVERVLYNLLTNALRHTPSDGSVAVVVEPDATEVRVSVEDTGEGMNATDGGGLGLVIAQGLVLAQGGRVWAENRPGGGARVSFTLPSVG
ncbi:MAG TPA: HAMP domain-containing sensor histidine kinase [Gaiellaceae bacterium]|nr:HAMP domain-containing sensor histidine kinase [Gaiellaceae bacterium]